MTHDHLKTRVNSPYGLSLLFALKFEHSEYKLSVPSFAQTRLQFCSDSMLVCIKVCLASCVTHPNFMPP